MEFQLPSTLYLGRRWQHILKGLARSTADPLIIMILLPHVESKITNYFLQSIP